MADAWPGNAAGESDLLRVPRGNPGGSGATPAMQLIRLPGLDNEAADAGRRRQSPAGVMRVGYRC